MTVALVFTLIFLGLIGGGPKWWSFSPSASQVANPPVQPAVPSLVTAPSEAAPPTTLPAAPLAESVQTPTEATSPTPAVPTQLNGNGVGTGLSGGADSGGAPVAKKKTLAICEISPTPAIADRVQADKKKNELDRVIQSLDGQLIDRMFNTRKFTILAHSDLPAIIKGGTFNPGTLKSLSDLDYVLVATIDDFADTNNVADNNLVFRNTRLSVVAKIYEATTSKLLESANFQLLPSDLPTGGVLDDQILVRAARKMADQIANRVTYVIYPPKVIDVSDEDVTINWGDSMFISANEVWEVCTVKEKKDPDTGDLTRILRPVGKVTIYRVDPTTSTGKILGNGPEIKEGCILRKPQTDTTKSK